MQVHYDASVTSTLLIVLRSAHPQPSVHNPFAPSLARRRFPPKAGTARNRHCAKKGWSANRT